jgi:thiamine pyrophosphate-dependent acetolactate synthase large subunit-like protein
MQPRPEGQILLSPSGSLESIGAGIAHAIAMKLAYPEHEVILHVGDGTFGYHIMEFETALRYGIPFVAVVHNDSAWGMTRDMQADFFGQGREIGNELLDIRYDRLVREMGGHGEYVTEPDQIEAAIGRALESNLPACVNVVVDPEPRSPGLEMHMMLEIMLGHQTFYDHVPKIVERAGQVGLDKLTSRLMRWFLAQGFQRKIK